MAIQNITYVDKIIKINEKIINIRDNFNQLSLKLIIREEELTKYYIRTLKLSYSLLLNEVKYEKDKVSSLTPPTHYKGKQIELLDLFVKLYDSTSTACNSVNEDMVFIDVSYLRQGIQEQQTCVEEINNITDELIKDLTNV
ncbi:TPA: hypothetical protein QC096_002240 [Bacillus thuringiensis]|nr:hypothetical protein [Bacillus thuringiensis]